MGIDYRLKQIIESLLNAANETLNDLSSDNSDIIKGELIGYAESLTIIQEMIPEEERKAYKLDFDIDKRYM